MSIVSYVQVSEKLTRIRIIARLLQRARECQYCYIVIGEAEYLLGRRTIKYSDGVSGTGCKLLTEMFIVLYNENQRKLVVATTSRPGDIDEGFARRFCCFIYVKLPEGGHTSAIIRECLSKYGVKGDVSNQKINRLASELASKRTLSAGDTTRALKVEVQDMLESEMKRAISERGAAYGRWL